MTFQSPISGGAGTPATYPKEAVDKCCVNCGAGAQFNQPCRRNKACICHLKAAARRRARDQ